jgi:uncharacterized protein (DUF697 family)
MSINKKKLPKAIRRGPNDPPPPASALEASIEREGRAIDPERREAASPALPSAGAESDLVQPAATQEKASATEQALVPRDASAAELDVTRRRAMANAIVKRYGNYAAGSGIIPLPIVNVAGVTAINIRMVKMLSDLYGVPFERDRTRAIVVGLAAGTMPTGLAAVAASTLSYFTPASAFFALAISSVTAATCTRSIGRTFVEHFESGAGSYDLAALQRREATLPMARRSTAESAPQESGPLVR